MDSKTASKLVRHLVKPQYPPIARVNYIQGRVTLEVLVNRKGSVTDVHVVKGEPLLAAAALKAVRKWRYGPFVSASGAKPFRTYVDVNFSLQTRRISELPSHPDEYLDKQIHPPEVVAHPDDESAADFVTLKVLVDSDGKVLDSMPLDRTDASVDTARMKVRRWKFRPARWGTLAIPWYLVVKVPVEQALTHCRASNENIP